MDTLNPSTTVMPTDQFAPLMEQLSVWMTVFFVVSLVLTLLIVVAMTISMIRRWKVQHAIFDIQKTLQEMNERDKHRFSAERPTPPVLADKDLP